MLRIQISGFLLFCMYSVGDLLFRFVGLILFFEILDSLVDSIFDAALALDEVLILDSADREDCS